MSVMPRTRLVIVLIYSKSGHVRRKLCTMPRIMSEEVLVCSKSGHE